MLRFLTKKEARTLARGNYAHLPAGGAERTHFASAGLRRPLANDRPLAVTPTSTALDRAVKQEPRLRHRRRSAPPPGPIESSAPAAQPCLPGGTRSPCG